MVLPCVPVPAWTHARAGPGNADADDRHLTNAGLGDAGHKSPGRERCVANIIHCLPGRSGPQQDLPSALLSLSAWLPPVGLGADGVTIRLRQGQTRGVGLGETDDVRSVLTDAAPQLRRFPFGRGPFDIPVEQFQGHVSMASPDGVVMMNGTKSVQYQSNPDAFLVEALVSASEYLIPPQYQKQRIKGACTTHENVPERISVGSPQEAQAAGGKTSLRSPGWQRPPGLLLLRVAPGI